MSEVKDGILGAMTKWLSDRIKVDNERNANFSVRYEKEYGRPFGVEPEVEVDRVLSWEEEDKSTGYCETCYYEYTELNLTYLGVDGQTYTYEYSGNFAEFMRDLTSD